MAYGVEVSVKLVLVMVELWLLFWVQVILAAQVRKRPRLSEGDVRVVDSESERRRRWLAVVCSVIWKFISTKFSMG